jgi:hypothetical protein
VSNSLGLDAADRLRGGVDKFAQGNEEGQSHREGSVHRGMGWAKGGDAKASRD